MQEAALGDFYDNTKGAKQANPGGSVGKVVVSSLVGYLTVSIRIIKGSITSTG